MCRAMLRLLKAEARISERNTADNRNQSSLQDSGLERMFFETMALRKNDSGQAVSIDRHTQPGDGHTRLAVANLLVCQALRFKTCFWFNLKTTLTLISYIFCELECSILTAAYPSGKARSHHSIGQKENLSLK